MVKPDRNTWQYIARRRLSGSDHGSIGVLMRRPKKVVNDVTGEWRPGAVERLVGIANKVLGVGRGRKVDGLREVLGHEEQPAPTEYFDGLSCDPQALGSYALRRNHKPKHLRLAQTGGVTAEERLTAQQKRWMEAMQGDDPEARERARREALSWIIAKRDQEEAERDEALAEMGYGEHSVPRASLACSAESDCDEGEYPELAYLTIDQEAGGE